MTRYIATVAGIAIGSLSKYAFISHLIWSQHSLGEGAGTQGET